VRERVVAAYHRSSTMTLLTGVPSARVPRHDVAGRDAGEETRGYRSKTNPRVTPASVYEPTITPGAEVPRSWMRPGTSIVV
jgi:hypothetical protein